MGAEAPAPIAEGNLRTTPFAHVLIYVLGKGMNGTLVVWPEPDAEGNRPRGQHRLLFANGLPIAARYRERATAIDRGMLELFTLVDAPYAFYDQDLVGDSQTVLKGRVDSLAIIAAALRGSARTDAVEAVLQGLGEDPLRIRHGAELDRFRFERGEQAFIDMVRAAPASATQIIAEWGDARMARRLLYLLAITRSVEPAISEPAPSNSYIEEVFQDMPVPSEMPADDLGSSSVPPARPASSAAPAPASGAPAAASSVPHASDSRRQLEAPEDPPEAPEDLSPELKDRWKKLADRARRLDRQNFFQILGVSRDGDEDAVQDAYVVMVKSVHPDRLPAELAPLKPWAENLFHFATRAKETLTSPTQRAEYVRSVQAGGGTPASERKVNAIVQAALDYQKAEVLFRRKEWDAALELLEGAVELNPDEGDFYAMEAWILFNKYKGDSAPFRRILDALDRALELRPQSDSAHFYKGMVLKRQGLGRKSLTHFRKAAELNPRNLEAVREVRLATMRGTRTSTPPTKKDEDGFLSKLFKKK
ncbi:MAG: DnaJ domain-containing protein [Myxococcota bacterium]